MWALGDRDILGSVLLFMGRWVFLLPLVLLVPAALWLRRDRLPHLAVAAAIVLGPIMGFRSGWRRVLPHPAPARPEPHDVGEQDRGVHAQLRDRQRGDLRRQLGRHGNRRGQRGGPLVELGSGTSAKTRMLLGAFRDRGTLRRFVPFDVDKTGSRARGSRSPRSIRDYGSTRSAVTSNATSVKSPVGEGGWWRFWDRPSAISLRGRGRRS